MSTTDANTTDVSTTERDAVRRRPAVVLARLLSRPGWVGPTAAFAATLLLACWLVSG